MLVSIRDKMPLILTMLGEKPLPGSVLCMFWSKSRIVHKMSAQMPAICFILYTEMRISPGKDLCTPSDISFVKFFDYLNISSKYCWAPMHSSLYSCESWSWCLWHGWIFLFPPSNQTPWPILTGYSMCLQWIQFCIAKSLHISFNVFSLATVISVPPSQYSLHLHQLCHLLLCKQS